MSLCYNIDEGEKSIPDWGHCPCGECIFFPRLCGGFLGTPGSSTFQRCAREVGSMATLSLSELWVGVSGPVMEGHPVHGGHCYGP